MLSTGEEPRQLLGDVSMVLRNFLRDESGATAIEYGLIAACISIAIITVATNVGSKLNTTFTQVQNALK
jgi:pilus assembly protein Flp/PilA